MRTAARRATEGLALTGVVVMLLRPDTRAHKLVRRRLDAAGRRVRWLEGGLEGASYRLRGRRPDPNVTDNVLADRIRSSLGGLEKRLDVPRIHVMVDGHVALLHGEVGSEADADELEQAVAAVSGVAGVESYLHVGLDPGGTRPSAGRAVHPPSDALRRLLDAAQAAGVKAEAAPAVVRGVLSTLADRLPADDRDQVAVHLPVDVRPLFAPPRRARRAAPVRTVHELIARIAATTSELPVDSAERVTTGVIDAFRHLVPEEARDVAAVLPEELRRLWLGDPIAAGDRVG